MRRCIRSWAVCITAEGLNTARFVRQAGEKGIALSRMRRISPKMIRALVREDQLPMLRELALQGGWTLKRGQRYGLGRMLERIRARWLLCFALLAALLALRMVSAMVWRINILNAGAYEADIRQALTEMGIETPLLRRAVDLGALRDALEWRYPRIAWFECGWRGAVLEIRPAEGVLPRRDAEASGPCDVVAARDGVVHTVVAAAGTPVVAPGDIVRKGDVLIRGEERTANGEVRPVAARGSVIARVWVGASVRMSAWETATHYTGQEQTVWTLATPWFDLWRTAEPMFEHYDTHIVQTSACSAFVPLVFRQETYLAAESAPQRRDQADLERDASAAAVRKLHEKVGAEESLIDIWGNCSMIDDENVLSVAIGEMHVEIGTRKPVSGMAASGDGAE